jgi:hypothetical protein
MNPWEELERELEAAIHPVFADRLLDDVLDSDNLLGAYGAVADLASVLHGGPTDVELAREAETIAAMAKIRRSAGTSVRSYGRRSLAAVAAAAAMSTSVAWASGLPVVVQEATAHALAEIGSVAARVRGVESKAAPFAGAGAPEAAVAANALDARPDTRLPELPVSTTPRGVPDELEPPAPSVLPVVEPSVPEAVSIAAPSTPSTPSAPSPAGRPAQPSPPEPELPAVTSEREIELPVDDALAAEAPVDETDTTAEEPDGGNGRPEDPGKPDDPGNKPDDPGKPEDPGNKPDDPGKPDDTGKPDNPGKPEDPVEPEPPADEPHPGPPEDNGKPEDPGPPDHAVANGLDKDKKND